MTSVRDFFTYRGVFVKVLKNRLFKHFFVSNNIFLFTAACYLALVLNIAFLIKMADILDHLEKVNLFFIISIPFLLVFLFFFLLNFLSALGGEKTIISILILISSLLSYAMYSFGIIVDRDMLDNIFQTYSGEAISYINIPFISYLFFLGVLPLLFISRIKIVKKTYVKNMLLRLLAAVVSLLAIALIIFSFYKDYASVGRNNPYLKNMIIPVQFIYDFARYINKEYFQETVVYQLIGEDAKIDRKGAGDHKKLFVLVVGETARSESFNYSGYVKDTNRYTQKFNPTYFNSVTSCGTATAISVPCMFSRFTRKEYSAKKAANQDNLLDVLQRSGFSVTWLENDGGCKGVCKNIPTIHFNARDNAALCRGDFCFDQVLVEEFISQLKNLTNENNLIVLHMVGSHGPTYYQRYPKSFAKFLPDCPRSDIQNCTQKELVNTYDNTILYTDYVLSEIIQQLANRPELEAAMLYVSDHGESLGESGIYLHGMPYNFAPKEQKEIPLLAWFSEPFIQAKSLDMECLKRDAESKSYSHDNLFDSVLGILNIKTKIYQSDLDIFLPCQADLPSGQVKTISTKQNPMFN